MGAIGIGRRQHGNQNMLRSSHERDSAQVFPAGQELPVTAAVHPRERPLCGRSGSSGFTFGHDAVPHTMLGEQARGGDAQQATTSSGLAHLEDDAVLQPQHLGRSAGKPQSTGGERQTGRRTHEQLVPSSLRSWATCSEIAAPETPRSVPASLTEPRRTPAAKARSCVGVTSAR